MHCTTHVESVTSSTTESLMQGHTYRHCTTHVESVTSFTTESLMQGHTYMHCRTAVQSLMRNQSHHSPLNHSCRDMHALHHSRGSHHSVVSLGSLTPDSCFVPAESRVTITIRTCIHFQWELNKPEHRLGVNADDSKWRHGGAFAAQV